MQITEAQLQYLQEVLGVSPPPPPQASASVEVVVLTEELSADESTLLTKILASIGLQDFAHITGSEIPNACHVLSFGRADVETSWRFPAIRQMMAGPDVQTHKKTTWTRLQQFQREWRS